MSVFHPPDAGGLVPSTISALSIWVANVANVVTEVTPGAGQSVRINGGGTAWEVFTPSSVVPTAITVANEGADTTCFPLFVTAATGDLGPKTNALLKFDSSNGTLAASSMVPSASDSGPLGTASLMWSDLFLASGSVINWNAGDFTLTHAANKMNLSGGLFGFSDASPTTVTGSERVIFEDADGGTSDWSFRVAGGAYGVVNFASSQGTLASPTIVNSGDRLGSLAFLGHDGTNYETAVEIRALVDGTPGNNDMPGRLEIYVTPDGSASPALAVTVSNNKSVTLAGTLSVAGGITPRVVTTASDTTAVIDVNVTDQYQLTAMSGDTTVSTTGTPVAGQKLVIRLKDNGTSRALTWDGVFRALGVTLPTATVISKTVYIGCIYNLTDTKWDAVSVAEEV